MKAGDILLFRAGKNIFEKIIAWGTDSVYYHVAVCVNPEMNLAIEAITRGGVRAIDLRKIPEETYDVYRIKETHSYNLNLTISYLVSRLNSKYDYRGVVFLGGLKLLAKYGRALKKTANKFQKEKDYFCSELCYEAFNFGGGIDIVPDVPEADVTSPADIAKSGIIGKIS